MKHPVSVSELLELHRLGEIYLKWAQSPFAMSEDDLQELQEISDRYSINHSSALFSFQRQLQTEMLTRVERTIDDAIEAIPGLAQALASVPTSPLDRPLSAGEASMLQDAMDRVSDPEEVADRKSALEAKDLADAAEWARERNAALREQLHEDNEVDRETQAIQAGELRVELMEQNEVEREIEILQQLSNVDELTPEEQARFDELVAYKVSAMNSGAHKIPVGVVQDAISTGHIQKIK